MPKACTNAIDVGDRVMVESRLLRQRIGKFDGKEWAKWKTEFVLDGVCLMKKSNSSVVA